MKQRNEENEKRKKKTEFALFEVLCLSVKKVGKSLKWSWRSLLRKDFRNQCWHFPRRVWDKIEEKVNENRIWKKENFTLLLHALLKAEQIILTESNKKALSLNGIIFLHFYSTHKHFYLSFKEKKLLSTKFIGKR